MDEEFELPEHIIHRIQSFLTGKEATRTSILSNAWHHAALTRPNLDFDVHDFRTSRDEDEPNTNSDNKFSKFVKDTISRYDELKLKISSLRFREYTEWQANVACSCVLYKELIPKALSMGATLLDIGGDFVLPNEVFEAENLARLSVEKCRINLSQLDRPVRCPRLKSLSLSHVDIAEPNQIYRIISGCPSIKTLSFVDTVCYTCSVGVGLANSHALTCLLCDTTFLNFVTAGDLSSKFPFLRDLTLHDFWAYPKEIVISSRSLERLNFVCLEQYSEKKIRFDVPSLRKFTYEGPLIHQISFAPTSKFRVVSRLAITENCGLSTAWFGKLENLVKELGRSEIHICLRLGSETIFNYEADEFQGVTKLLLEVNNFTVDLDGLSSLTCCVLFDGLFRICRPKLVTHYLLPESSCGGKTNNDFLGKRLVEGVNGKFSIGRHLMSSVNDLKEVNVQLFDDDVGVWTPLPWDSFLDASRSTNRKREIRFQLEWKP